MTEQKYITHTMITILVIGAIIGISFALVSLVWAIVTVDWHWLAHELGAVAASFMEGLNR